MSTMIARAAAAEEAGHLDLAVAAWAEFRERFPEHYRGYLSGGMILKRLGRLPEAAEVFQEGFIRFPNNQALAIAEAWTALELGNLAHSRARWREIRRSFPLDGAGYIGGGLAARRAAAFDEADEIYRAGMERLPDDPTVHMDYAWNAEARNDMLEAGRRWGVVRAKFPDVPEGYIRRGLCLSAAGRWDDADRALAEAIGRYPDSEEALTEYAFIPHAQHDWAESLKRSDLILRRSPHLQFVRRLAVEALMELGRCAEAANVLAPEIHQHPDDPDICILHGSVVTRGGDFKRADPIWRDVRERFPERIEGYRDGALALAELNRWDEAESVLTQAQERFPGDPAIALAWAQVPERQQQWSVAAERWRDAVHRFPETSGGHLGLGNCLLAQKNIADAESVFKAAAARFPDDPEIATGYGRTLHESGRLPEAVVQLRGAVQRFPGHLDSEVALAFALSALRDWPQALALWESLKLRHPDNNELRTHITYILGQALADQGITGGAAFDIPPALLLSANIVGDPGPGQNTAALLKRFESLGESCEFGMVQRLYQVENASLLRWAETSPKALVDALNARFEGVGNPEHTAITVVAGEYRTNDRRYGMHCHTFTSPAAEPIELFAPEQCRRIQWLRRKLIDSLTAASKVFVYTYEGISDAEAAALYGAMRQYSPHTKLLCVRLETPGHPMGTVEQVEGGLLIGYIDKFSTIDISVNAWLSLCQAVQERLDS